VTESVTLTLSQKRLPTLKTLDFHSIALFNVLTFQAPQQAAVAVNSAAVDETQ
jgi:hypothetical protein